MIQSKPSEKGEIIPYLSQMGDVLEQVFKRNEITENFFRILILSHRNVPNALFREYELMPPYPICRTEKQSV